MSALRLVCPHQEEFDVSAAELVLVRDPEIAEAEEGVGVYAYLLLAVEDDEVDDTFVQSESLTVSLGHPLELAAARISQDSGLLQLMKEDLLNTFPGPCSCLSGDACTALATEDHLRVALRRNGG